MKKGTKTLPVFRCARGSTSLESFHLHVARFIPGTSASAMHCQVHLLEGLVRWNEDRATAAAESAQQSGSSSYDSKLRQAVRMLGESVLQKDLVPGYARPNKFTGELIGVEYLYSQTGEVLQEFTLDPDSNVAAQLEMDELDVEDDQLDEGFVEEEEDPTVPQVTEVVVETVVQDPPSSQQSSPPSTEPSSSSSSQQSSTEASVTAAQEASLCTSQPGDSCEAEESVGPDNIPGFEKVEDLACFLFGLRNRESRALTNSQAEHVIRLWNNLSPYDKRPSRLSPRYKTNLSGRFKSRTSMVDSPIPGLQNTKRNFLGQNVGPAQWPDSNRYMESLIVKLQCEPIQPDYQGQDSSQMDFGWKGLPNNNRSGQKERTCDGNYQHPAAGHQQHHFDTMV